MKPLSVAAIQFDICWENKAKNLVFLSDEIRKLPSDDKVVFLPEMFATGFSMNALFAEAMEGETVNWMRTTAQSAGKIICGSLMIREEDKIFNRLIWMLPNGLLHYYDKRHLFAYGGEDKVFAAGEKRLIVQVNGWKICLMVCYDLRFPVWCRQQQNEPFDVLVFVANWPEKRSLAWRTLLQARAIENQCYVIGVNRVGEDGNAIAHIGDSLIIDPLGKILQEAPRGESSILHQLLQAEKLEDTRSQFPFLIDADRFLVL